MKPRKAGYFRTLMAAAIGRLAVKASAVGPMISRMMLGRPVWPQRDYEKLGKEGYQQNPVVYACIREIANSVADIEWVMYQGRGDKRTEVEEHEFFDMLDHPNPMQDRKAFIVAVVSHYLISGNAFLERTQEKNFARMELYAHRPDRMRVVPGETGVPMAYEYTVNGMKRLFDVDPDSEKLPILHLKTFNPVDDWYGQSPLDAAAWAIDIHNGESQQTRALQESGGSPSGALIYEGTKEGGDTLSDEARETIQARLRGEERGYDQKGGRMFMDGGKYTWLQFGLDPDKLKSLDSKNAAAREIAFSLGVPPMLLGIPGDNTYSNYQEARQAFYQETVIPLAWMLTRAFSFWFRTQLGKGVTLEPNIDDLDALQPTRKEQWERIDRSTILSLNEKREALGYEPVKGGEKVMAGMGQIPIDQAGMDIMGGPAPDGDEDDPLKDITEDDDPKKKPGAKHMPSGAVHRRAD